MSADDVQSLNVCGCCEVAGAPTPVAIQNRAGLSSIQYRVGAYASFLLAMTEEIAQTPELQTRWLARSSDDFGIALLAMWAYVGDILTFYQERIANEAYLRTAVLQESVVRLAALIDYTPGPGAAAEADVAFFLEPNRQLQIPVGLRMQSVPGQNEKPRKFETVESITANAALNQVQVFPQSTVYAPFARGSTQAVLLSDAKGLAPRVKLAIFDSSRAELKDVTGISVRNTQQVVAWTPAIQSTDFDVHTTQTAVYARQFRLFGYNAPYSYVQAVKDATAVGGIRFDLLQAPYTNSNLPTPPTNRLALDARYSDLKPGSTFMIWQAGSSANPSDTFARLATATNVSAEAAVYGPLQGTVSWLTLDSDVPITDSGRVTVLEVTRLLSFSSLQYGDGITGNTLYVPLAAIPGITDKRSIILDDAAGNPMTVRIQAVQQVDTNGDGQADHWQVAFAPDLSRTLATATATLYGNVCAATHGQTIAGEVLGNGDASATFQSFLLQKSPVTHVHKTGAPHGVADTL
jgi:hypothetical protein